MNGDQCQWPEKMMGRGGDGGCGTKERPLRPFRRASSKKAKRNNGTEDLGSPAIGLLAQASKALSERSPFDVPDDGSTSGLSVPTLPIGLANLLKHSDSRKRHKKPHSGVDKKKKSSRQGEKLRGGNIWVETEEYFRSVDLPDIETLSDLLSLRSLSSRNCFSVPLVGCEPITAVQRETDAGAKIVKSEDTTVNGCTRQEVKDIVKETVNEGYLKEEVKAEDGQPMDVDIVGAECLLPDENVRSDSDHSGSLEWVLGSRNRILLTSERPSKKRKLLGGDAGLEKLMVFCPREGNALACDFCCSGDAKEHPNQLIVCNSCKATVHKKCYGVHEDVDKSWLCTWCKQKNGRSDFERPCVLCPKKGGALKPVCTDILNGGRAQFAHLFCSLWMPEVYIEDLKKMEPIVNLDGIKETRKKLVCNLCKLKSGACVRCSNGMCRTSFHPVCARDAGNRLEVWGKYGRDTIELRAFCSKHSNIQESGRSTRGGDRNAADGRSLIVHLPSEGHLNNENVVGDIGTPGTSSDISGNSELRDMDSPHSKLDSSVLDSGEAQVDSGMFGRSNFKEIPLSESLSFGLILKKLIDRGKVDAKDVAAEIGINPDALSARLTDGNLVPELRGKIVKWLGKHAYMGIRHKGGKVKGKDDVSTKSEGGTVDCAEGITVHATDVSDSAVVKPFGSERKSESNSRNSNAIFASAGNCHDNGTVVDEAEANKLVEEEQASMNLDSDEKPRSIAHDGQDHLGKSSVDLHDAHEKSLNCDPEVVMPKSDSSMEQSASRVHGIPVCSNIGPVILDLLDRETYSRFNLHPYIHKDLSQMCKRVTLKTITHLDANRITSKSEGPEGGITYLQGFPGATVCCNHQNQHPECDGTFGRSDCQLSKARELGLLDLSPEDDLEGELLYCQLQLFRNAASRKKLSDSLVYEVAKKLPWEIDTQHGQKWDDVLVNKYFYDLREARKQGRKEKKHKEAQAVLAAATAAAATSSRISPMRKDFTEEPLQQENFSQTSSSKRKVGGGLHLLPRAKETLSKMAVLRTPSEKQSDRCASEFSVENPRTCDICRRSETIWNLILVCSSCKVAVHLDCYRCTKESTGPWYCELCEELSSSTFSGGPLNFWEKPYSAAQCALCDGTTGAFRKAANGQWVHAFCAEWVLESSFKRGQIDPVQGMDDVLKETEACCVCRRKHGACIKCNYGNCQTTFHPSCARSAGFYMTGGGKLPHKAYCEKHSLEQKSKAEAQKHGAEELKNLKQYRVELERLRLLCERIVKREKIKRELVLSSHEILAVKRDHAARSLLARGPFFPPEVSSDSATTSIKGHPDSNKSGSEAIQRSDDVTIDSTPSVKRRGKGPILADTDQKTDDGATSKSRFSRKPTERQSFSGKTIPRRHNIVSPSGSEDGERGSKSKKQVETFAKELVMTSDEASMKNRRLPKGYFYVPVDCLQEDDNKPANRDASSGGERSGRDG